MNNAFAFSRWHFSNIFHLLEMGFKPVQWKYLTHTTTDTQAERQGMSQDYSWKMLTPLFNYLSFTAKEIKSISIEEKVVAKTET